MSGIPDTTPFAVFWDIENCGIPTNISISDAIKNICNCCVTSSLNPLNIRKFAIYGEERCFEKFKTHIVRRSSYANLECDDIPLSCEVEIFTVADAAVGSSRKLDLKKKKILADMFLFMIDQHIQNHEQQVGIILISSDVDFQYSIKQLTNRGCKTILIHGRNARSSFIESATANYDWFSLVRGLNKRRAERDHQLNVDWIRELEKALETLLDEKLLITEASVRAKMKLDGKHRDKTWNVASNTKGFTKLLTQATIDQETLEHYDPSEADWDNFTLSQLKILYNIIVESPGEKRNGKYPMALFFRYKLKAAASKKKFPTGKLMEFVELAIQQGWISYKGRATIIQPMVLQAFPYKQIFEGESPTIPTHTINTPKIALSTAKSALQHYFQKSFRMLPNYECSRTGPDHSPLFKVTVCVKLPEGKFVDGYFYESGESNSKKEAEKLAARHACETLLSRYLPDFQFPTDYLES